MPDFEILHESEIEKAIIDNLQSFLLELGKGFAFVGRQKRMQWLALTYTRRFNNRHFRSDHLFQGRFKSIIVQNDAYLMRLSCYIHIHRNPLRAGIIARLAEYPWSSYKA